MNARTLLAQSPIALIATLALAGCATRYPEPDASADVYHWDNYVDPRVPNVGQGNMAPSCSSEAVIDLNGSNPRGFHEGNEWRIRLETINRRDDIEPDCVDRDGPEAVVRYTTPPMAPDGRMVQALRVSTIAAATSFDTVLTVRNQCEPDARDYSCNNDGALPDGRQTRRSTVYYVGLEPEQYVYIVVDGYDGSLGRAEVVVEEIWDLGVLGQPCLPIPPTMLLDPRGPYDASRCPSPGLQCSPSAASDGTDLCLPLLPLGEPCDPDARRNVCEPRFVRGVTCARNPMDATQSVCALPGTAPGAPCRPDAPGQVRCDGRLTCSPGTGAGDPDICVPLRGSGASCDPSPRGFTNRCEDGLTCCGDSPDAGASFYCRPNGWSPCHPFIPMTF